MKFSKQAQAGKYSKKTKVKKSVLHIPESSNQKFANEYLLLKKIQNIRVSDSVWNTLQFKAPIVKMLLAKGDNGIQSTADPDHNGLAGVADNTTFYPISDKFSLAMHLEHKSTTGKLSGAAQKAKADVLPYTVTKTPEAIIEAVDELIEVGEELKEYFENKKGD